MEVEHQQSPRRWLRFSLRTMMIVVTIVALLLGLWIIPSLRQYWVVQQIHAAGGKIYKRSEVNKDEGEEVKIGHWSWHLFNDVTLVEAKINEDTNIDWRSLPKLNGCEIRNSTGKKKSTFPEKIKETLKNQLPSKLEILGISANEYDDVTDETLSYLTRFPHLTHFSANLSVITDKGFQNLAQLKKLKHLHIGRGLQVKNPINLNIMNEWPDLENFSLRLMEGNVTWDQIRFREFHKLKEFELTFSGFSNDAILKISELPAVKKLWLEFNDQKLADQSIDEGVVAVAKMPKLIQLSIDGNAKIGDAAFIALGQSKTITQIWLNCQYNSADLTYLATMPQLEEIHYRHGASRVDDQIAGHLALVKSLKRLDLREAKLTDAGLEKLTALENLEELNISETRVTAVGISSLIKFKNLKSLRLRQTPLRQSPAAMTQLRKELKELPNVKILD